VSISISSQPEIGGQEEEGGGIARAPVCNVLAQIATRQEVQKTMMYRVFRIVISGGEDETGGYIQILRLKLSRVVDFESEGIVQSTISFNFELMQIVTLDRSVQTLNVNGWNKQVVGGLNE
jgi:hypothetical protein